MATKKNASTATDTKTQPPASGTHAVSEPTTPDPGQTADDAGEEDLRETQAERSGRLDLERAALRSSPSDDSLRARLLALLGGNQYTDLENRDGCSHERALFRYAAATTKAVAMALQGADYVCSNEPFETEFSTAEAATVLCGLSALMEIGPDLVEDIRHADPEMRA